VTVDASSYRTTYATARLWSKRGGCWRVVAGPWTARVGRSGLSAHHREGDGTTPTEPDSACWFILGIYRPSAEKCW
jgi:L,D-peptidoglycan transpeptidase YkuD (ErfK/YbiS/YcfS/YnhG family)